MNKRRQRHLRRLRENPKNCSPDELKAALEAFGFTLKRQSGSHMTFYREGSGIVTVPFRRPVKQIYVQRILDMLGEIEEV
jgi:predicted RNA binding protein YcfA (HicA-like mRNA interferase family)